MRMCDIHANAPRTDTTPPHRHRRTGYCIDLSDPSTPRPLEICTNIIKIFVSEYHTLPVALLV